MAGSLSFSGRKDLRSDFRPELKRVQDAIRACDALERELASLLAQQLHESAVPGRGRALNTSRGSASVYVRLTEQRLSNRLQKQHLLRLLWDMKRNVLDRELKIAALESQAAAAAQAAEAGGAAAAALIAFFQSPAAGLRRPAEVLEPGEYRDAEPGPAPLPPPSPPGEGWPEGLPEDVEAGDLFCGPGGEVYVAGEGGVEEAGATAEEVFMAHPSGAPPHARLADGRLVLVFELPVEDGAA